MLLFVHPLFFMCSHDSRKPFVEGLTFVYCKMFLSIHPSCLLFVASGLPDTNFCLCFLPSQVTVKEADECKYMHINTDATHIIAKSVQINMNPIYMVRG